MISIAAETITHIGPVPITNALIDTILVDIVLISSAIYISKHVSLQPGKFQNIIEMLFDGFYGLTKSVTGPQANKVFPFIMTFFLFILVSNWSGLMPVITALGFHHEGEFIPFIRSASTDLNTTIGLAICSLVATHGMSIQTLGFKSYITRFFPLSLGGLYQGILELVSELTKIISFSFRLFGNIFVGEIILGTLSSAFAFLAPIPVIMYEFFVGAIQASIFALLTMAFMAIFTTPHGHDAKAHE